MTKAIRFTSEKQQELISRNQFCERVIKFGWMPVSPEDLGEDFIVHVYFEKRATGVSFYVQEKSITNLLERRKGDFLPYSFEVKDLKHWESFAQPVVLMIWDIQLREGRWGLLHDAIEYIDKKRPQWRTQKKAQVYIPWNNTTDDDGLLNLQYAIGKAMFPIIGKDKELSMKMTLSSPSMWENQEMAEAFRKFHDEGEEVTLKGDVIKAIEIPDWAKPWFNTSFSEIKMRSSGSTELLPVDINIVTFEGESETIKGVELKFIKIGAQTLYLSNEHQSSPLAFEFVFSSSKECSASIKINNLGSNVNVTRDILRFQKAMSEGGKLQLFSLKDNKPIPIDVPVPIQHQLAPSPEYLKIIDHLCVIQAKTGQFITIETDGISTQELQIIAELSMIIDTGKVFRTGKTLNRQFEMEPPEDIFDYLERKQPISLTEIHDDSSAELFDQKFEMGQAIEQVTGTLDMTYSELEKALETHKEEGFLPLQLADVEIVVTFPKWIKST